MTIEHTPSQPRFRPCVGCGNLVPDDTRDCQYCGFRSVEVVAAEKEAERERHFFHALFNRSNPFTMIFIGVNLGVFLLMWMAGGMSVTGTDENVLRGFGAKVNELIDQQHQYWRFVTSVFIHIGFLHIFFNMYALWIIGQEIERLYGSSRFVIIYLVCGIAGSLASYLYNPGAMSAGASGAIFGLFGVMAVFAFRYRKELPSGLASEIKRRILPVILINLAIGFSIKVVDNAAHIGGLLTGVVLCFLIPYKRPHEKATASVWRIFLVASLLVIVASFASAFINYDGPRPSLANLRSSPGSSGEESLKGINTAADALVESVNSFSKIVTGKNERADTRPALDAVERGIQALKNVPKVTDDSDLFKQRLLDLLTRQKEIIERHNQMKIKDWQRVERDEVALIDDAERFGLIKQVDAPDEK
jgi:rhomboid protease GluP